MESSVRLNPGEKMRWHVRDYLIVKSVDYRKSKGFIIIEDIYYSFSICLSPI